MSLSLFVWHQLILAYIRYAIIQDLNWTVIFIFLALTLLVSWFSYKFIENIKLKKTSSQIIFFSLLITSTALAFAIYRHAGVVRDVPELGITFDHPYENRNTEYTDQFYNYDKPFETSKPHVLVIGNSFARDFAAILKEYDQDNKYELSYSFDINETDDIRISEADYIFYFGKKSSIPENKLSNIQTDTKIYGIGTKSFGRNFGIFYAKRNSPEYLTQSIQEYDRCAEINRKWQSEWGKDNFVDLMNTIKLPNGDIPLFTPWGRVISFDCRHLTQDGAKYYAEKIDFNKIFE